MIVLDASVLLVTWIQAGCALSCVLLSWGVHGRDFKIVRVYCDLFALSFWLQNVCVLVVVMGGLDPSAVAYKAVTILAAAVCFSACVACDLYLVYLRFKLISELNHGPISRRHSLCSFGFSVAAVAIYSISEINRVLAPNTLMQYSAWGFKLMNDWAERGYVAYHVVYLLLTLRNIRVSRQYVEDSTLRRYLVRIGVRACLQQAGTFFPSSTYA